VHGKAIIAGKRRRGTQACTIPNRVVKCAFSQRETKQTIGPEKKHIGTHRRGKNIQKAQEKSAIGEKGSTRNERNDRRGHRGVGTPVLRSNELSTQDGHCLHTNRQKIR
jgi:hypothetical protein